MTRWEKALRDWLCPDCGHVLTQHTSNGFGVECECGCRKLADAEEMTRYFLDAGWSPWQCRP